MSCTDSCLEGMTGWLSGAEPPERVQRITGKSFAAVDAPQGHAAAVLEDLSRTAM